MFLLAICLTTVLVGGVTDDLPGEARAARTASDWAELEDVSTRWAEAEPQSAAARAHLALALANNRKFDECVSTLREIQAMGRSVDETVRGFGAPMLAVVDALYVHCWANWDPAFNRQVWQGLFDAFPDSSANLVPAARLLMSALKLGDKPAVERFEAFFDARLQAADKKRGGNDKTRHYYAQAYARAGVPGEKPLRLAAESFGVAWESAARAHRYQGPDAQGGDDLAKVEKCDIDTDDEYNVLALTCALNGKYGAPDNPLAIREAESTTVFDDVTTDVGLGGVSAGRVAVGDYDDDGHLDLCFSGRLFRNVKGKSFEDVTDKAGIAHRGSSALFGDYDNDGDLDLLLPSGRPRLLRNTGKKGGFKFEDVTAAAGLNVLKVEAGPEGAAWFDVDGDGWLDFYLAVYERPMSTGHPDLLVRNNGDGTFTEITQAAGVAVETPRCGRGVSPADYDDDGDADLYISNYRLNPNFLFRNEGGGRFSKVDEALGIHGVRQPADGIYYGHTIGSCFGDIDNDGDLDLFAANLAHPRFITQGFSNLSMLYVNQGTSQEPRFVDERRDRGIRFQETHSDPAFADIDNDGDLDLSITCIYEGVPTALYRNDGDGNFAPVTFGSHAVAFNGWGQAWFDYDGDGDLDFLAASGTGCRLFRNRGNDNHWLEVRLVAKKKNRYGIGARLLLETLGEERRVLVRELASARGTTSQDGEIVHFGLGDHSGRVRLTVRWPDTLQEETQTLRTDRRVRVKQVRTVPKR